MEAMRTPPAGQGIRLEALAERHRAALGAACAEDPAIWRMYATDMGPRHFDATFTDLLASPDRFCFAVFEGDALVGISGYLYPNAARQTVEIGNTYLRPAWRGTGLNGRLKALMIGHAFANGIRRIVFLIDDRNARSKAAVAKIGGVFEGLLRAERITWTGHVRDSALFSILAEEWPG